MSIVKERTTIIETAAAKRGGTVERMCTFTTHSKRSAYTYTTA